VVQCGWPGPARPVDQSSFTPSPIYRQRPEATPLPDALHK